MFLSQAQLAAAQNALDEAQRTFHCDVARVDETGASSFGEGDRAVAYGPHGAAFVQVDPKTLVVRCGACAGDVDATARAKKPVERRGRTHMLTT